MEEEMEDKKKKKNSNSTSELTFERVLKSYNLCKTDIKARKKEKRKKKMKNLPQINKKDLKKINFK
jgi:hypothetical protein